MVYSRRLGSGGALQIDRQCVESQRGAYDRGYDGCSEGTMIDRSKFAQIRDEIIAENGDLIFFALFLREGAEDRWDLLASASWLDRDEPSSLRYLTKQLTAKLSERELLEVSRIVIVEQNDPALRRLLRNVTATDGEIQTLENVKFGSLTLSRAIIFEAKPSTMVALRRGA